MLPGINSKNHTVLIKYLTVKRLIQCSHPFCSCKKELQCFFLRWQNFSVSTTLLAVSLFFQHRQQYLFFTIFSSGVQRTLTLCMPVFCSSGTQMTHTCCLNIFELFEDLKIKGHLGAHTP
jgi:hypothetical protein